MEVFFAILHFIISFTFQHFINKLECVSGNIHSQLISQIIILLVFHGTMGIWPDILSKQRFVVCEIEGSIHLCSQRN